MQQWYDRRKKSKPLRCDGLIIDLDGVIWRGGEPIEGAADAIAAIRAIGTRVLFLTSDPGSSRPQLAARLMENGIGATSAYVMTSAASTDRVIGTMEDLPSRRALVVGPRAHHAEIQSTGLELVTGDAAREAAVVVVGCDVSPDTNLTPENVRRCQGQPGRVRSSRIRGRPRGRPRTGHGHLPICHQGAQYGVTMEAGQAGRTRSALEKALVGPAGEHFVLFRLYQQGMLASLSPPGSPTVDVLVLAPDESIIATLQVKTRTGVNRGWPMSEKHEHISEMRCFYAFVDLRVPVGHMPVTYIIPSQVVADVLKRSHETWLKTPGRGGRAHRTNPVRQVLTVYGFPMPDKYQEGWMEKYRERWDLLRAAVE